MTSGHRRRGGPADGFALVDVLIAAVLVVSLAGMVVPLTAQVSDVSEVRAAAGYLAGRLRQARFQAVTHDRATALVFDQDSDGRWQVRRCHDGNSNGVRRAEIASRIDRCDDPPESLHARFPNATMALMDGTPDIDGAAGTTSGVRFGAGSMASCSPAGHCTPGTMYLVSRRGKQYAVRVSGIAGRARLYHFDAGIRRWAPD